MAPSFSELVESEVKNDGQSVLLILVAEMEKIEYSADDVDCYSRENHIVKQTAYLRSEAIPIINKNDIKEMIVKSSAHIIELINDYVNYSSCWRLSRCEALFFSFAKYRPFNR